VDRLGYKSPLTLDQQNHISEVELNDHEFNYVIQVNDGDLDELRKDAVRVFDHVVESFNPPEFHTLYGTEAAEEIRKVTLYHKAVPA
jgi:subtilase family serine protease